MSATTPPRAPVFRCAECEAVWRTETQRDLCCKGEGAGGEGPQTTPEDMDREEIRQRAVKALTGEASNDWGKGYLSAWREVLAVLYAQDAMRRRNAND